MAGTELINLDKTKLKAGFSGAAQAIIPQECQVLTLSGSANVIPDQRGNLDIYHVFILAFLQGVQGSLHSSFLFCPVNNPVG